MGAKREELRARLEAEADAVISELLAWNETAAEPTFADIEQIVLKVRQQFGERLGQILAEEQAATVPVPGPSCPECGRETRYKGRKRRRIDSQLGSVGVERGYYFCQHCREKVFPPGPATGGRVSP